MPTPERSFFGESIDVLMDSTLVDLARLGFSVSEILSLHEGAFDPEKWSRLHLLSQVLFAQWSRQRAERDQLGSLATARIFNRVTKHARDCISSAGGVELFLPYIATLTQQLHRISDQFSGDSAQATAEYAAAIETAAQLHTHETAWLWCVLPVFGKQHYGRVLVSPVPTQDERYPIFVTQTFFLAGEATLRHTHGQNWAFARPLGVPNTNEHINTTWSAASAQNPFPLSLVEKRAYDSRGVIAIPPRTIHAISRSKRSELTQQKYPSIAEVRQNPDLLQSEIALIRFGELACLHAYIPDWETVSALESSPLVQNNRKFFIENDMVVFDSDEQSVWAGGGGAWSRRMIEYGPTGEHCGECFEEDRLSSDIDPDLAHAWLLALPAKRPVQFLR